MIASHPALIANLSRKAEEELPKNFVLTPDQKEKLEQELIKASKECDVDLIVNILTTNSALIDLNAKEDSAEGFSALHNIVFAGDLEIVEILLKLGADPNVKDADQRTPIHWAVLGQAENAIALIEILRQYGGDLEAKDKFNLTPIYYALNEEILDYFIMQQVNLDITDINGYSLLHTLTISAAVAEDLETRDKWLKLYQMLIEAGAKQTIDSNGYLPQDYLPHIALSAEERILEEDEDNLAGEINSDPVDDPEGIIGKK